MTRHALTTRLAPAAIGLCMATFACLGCNSRTHVRVSDPDAAIALVDASFQAWKQGESVESLRQGSPSVYVAEDLWKPGFQLTDYDIDDNVEVYGTNVRVHVTLTGTDSNGRQVTRKLTYLVTTTPAQTIARADR